MKNTQKTDFRDWLLKSLAGLIGIFIVSFAINFSKEKKEREKWVKESIPECPTTVDSLLTIQHCYFNKTGIAIEATILKQNNGSVDEEQAIMCFFHLCGYDMKKVRECYKLLEKRRGVLDVVLNDIDNNQLGKFEYQLVDFERLWDICIKINQNIEELNNNESPISKEINVRKRDNIMNLRSPKAY